MAQHDYNLANQSGADFRADLNNALSAIATTNSGATSPSTTFAHQLWVDTANSVLKIRNSANDAWITTGVSITADNTFDINGGTVNGITSFSFSTGSTVTSILDEDDLSSDSATALATQQSIKAYVDSQVGSVDTLAEILLNGNTTGGTDIEFGDNDKAIFGTGSDLQIYHSGAGSYIDDSGDGSLYIRANNLYLQKYTGETYLAGVSDSSVYLYYNGLEKLRTLTGGIDVTGTVTADGLTVDGGSGTVASFKRDAGVNGQLDLSFPSQIATLNTSTSLAFQTSATEKMRLTSTGLGIGTSSPNEKLHVVGGAATVKIDSSTNVASLAYDNSTTTGAIELANNDLYTVLGGSVVMRILANGDVGIGATSPSAKLHVGGTTNLSDHITLSRGGGQFITKNDNSQYVLISGGNAGDSGQIILGGGTNGTYTGNILFRVGTTTTGEAARFDSSGNFGIGTTSPTQKLEVDGAVLIKDSNTEGTLYLTNTSVGVKRSNAVDTANSRDIEIFTDGAGANVVFSANGAGSAEMVVTDSGSVGIGTDAPNTKLEVNGSIELSEVDDALRFANSAIGIYRSSGNLLNISGYSGVVFRASAANYNSQTEVGRFDSSGHLLVGTTSTSPSLSNVAGIALRSEGHIYASRDGGVVSYFNRMTTDGTILDFRKDGTNVGEIGSTGGDLYIGRASSSSLRFQGAGIRPSTGATLADATYELGGASARFTNLHLSGTANVGEINITASNPEINFIDTSNTNTCRIRNVDGKLQYDADLNNEFGGSHHRWKADGSDLMFLNSTGLGIGTTSPAEKLHLLGSSAMIRLQNNVTNWNTGLDAADQSYKFKHNGSEKARIDSSGNLLVGTTTATVGFNNAIEGVNLRSEGRVFASADQDYPLNLSRNTSDGDIAVFRKDGSTVGSVGTASGTLVVGTTNGSGSYLKFGSNVVAPVDVNGTVRDNAIDLGQTNARFKDLHLSGVANVGEVLADTGTTNRTAKLEDDGLYISRTSDGNYVNKIIADTASNNMAVHARSNINFYLNSDLKATITDGGNLLVGTTDNSLYNNTTGEGVLIAPDHIQIARDSDTTAVFNRQGTDGQVITFNKAGATIGSIGTVDSDLTIYTTGSGHKGLRFGNGYIAPTDNTGTTTDNTTDLGLSSQRFKDIYATNGTIQTSDINEKQDIEDLSEAETRVAVAAKGLLKKYRWKSAVADKGDDARIHFGIMAQDLKNAFANEGLDAGDYGMFISTTWTDEATGEEKTRLGVRYNELLAFIIAAI